MKDQYIYFEIELGIPRKQPGMMNLNFLQNQIHFFL